MLVIGSFDESLLCVHKRTRKLYTVAEYRLLKNFVSQFGKILVTPHVLAETSALLNQIGEPKRSKLAAHFGCQVEEFDESISPASLLVRSPCFVRLGLTDAGLLEICKSGDVALITADLDLYLEVLKTNPNAINFNHLRARAM